MSAPKRISIDCDKRILLIVLVLVGIGASLVASSSSFFAGGTLGDHFALMRRHLVRSGIALIVLILAMKVDYRVYRKMSPMFLVLGVLLLVGLLGFGSIIRGTKSWYAIPRLNATLQPSEFTRVALVFFLAYWITRKGNDFVRFRTGFLPAAIATVLVVGLIAMAPDYGTATATLAIATVMLYIGGARLSHLTGFLGVIGAGGVLGVLSEPHVRTRIAHFFERNESLTDANWQIHQSLLALGSGGVSGVGLGNSQQQLSWLPDSYTDFIFSILGEELGLIGTVLVSGLFLLLVLRALKISRSCDDTYGEMLVVGFGASIFVYAVINMFVATGLFPVTGLPLPFVSYGGSALVVNAFATGVLLNVSRRGQKPVRQRRRAKAVARA